MQQHRDKKVQDEFDTNDFGLHLAVSQGWHFGIEENFLSPNLLPRSATSSNQLNFELFGGQISEVPGGRQEQGSVATSILSGPKIGEYFVQETQQDQVGSSNIYPELQGVPHYGTSPPFVLSEEPVYVNAKQYHAILRRRQLRAKAEMENKATRVRKPYLHESRHLHALRRARGCGGRFINTKKANNSRGNATQEEVNSNDIDHSPPSKKYISQSVHSQYSSTVTSNRVEPSSSTFDDYKMLSLQGSNCADYFQWSHHKSFLSK